MSAVDPAAVPEGLSYCNDEQPGIRRTMTPAGFAYHNARGEKIEDEKVLARIRALAIPPAWTDVWICPRANGHQVRPAAGLRPRPAEAAAAGGARPGAARPQP